MRHSTLLALSALLTLGCGPRDRMTAAVDTTAVQAGVDSTRSRYAALQMAGDAAGVAALYDEDATLDLYGVPRTRGRANIENALRTTYGMFRFTTTEITPLQTNVRNNDAATEIGTYHNMLDSSGVVSHEWGRFAVGLRKGADGMWRLTYLMAFPDSTKR